MTPEQRRSQASQICAARGVGADVTRDVLNAIELSLESERVRIPNLAPVFLAELTAIIACVFVSEGEGDGHITFGPRTVFGYVYACLHSPTYRARYAPFLKTDFPRVPKPLDRAMFFEMAQIGTELENWHLLDESVTACIPHDADPPLGLIERAYPKWEDERIYISPVLYFEGVSAQVWDVRIGGYQVARKWLSDRRGRHLDVADCRHFRLTLTALARTQTLMLQVDTILNRHQFWEQRAPDAPDEPA